MRRLLRRQTPATAAGPPSGRIWAAGAAFILAVAGIPHTWPGPGGPPAPASPAPTATPGAAASSFHQIFLPDLLVIEPAGLSHNQLTRLSRISGVRNLVTADGALIRLGHTKINVLGVNPGQFRSWTPLATATDQRLWTALQRGRFVTSDSLARQLHLRAGATYQLAGGAKQDLALGGSAPLGISGIGALVNSRFSAGLGLVPGVLALISAPGASMTALTRAVRHIAGQPAQLISLRRQQQPRASGGRPSSYLQLFKDSAARYCPGMSWTVLAAIGQIESGDGSNMGPSTAGALGPMQFLPSTWAEWGITAFGETGPPNVMDAFDAVPSAARLLCAAGAGTPAGLRGAIFAYNHATWYVNEVLGLAQEYARDYG
ncbi:MAG TPA: lytic transglycosylase domain-containing protein [Streptosporangiaceae bacterium]|nr:lytic transglycosylase domain-containing protein [Streptosporangiaceae bacterium]